MSTSGDATESFKAERYLNANYLSLARPVELHFKSGRVADAFFAGIHSAATVLVLRRFCFRDEETFEEVRQVKLSDLSFFLVKDIFIQPKTSLKKTSTQYLAESPSKQNQARLDKEEHPEIKSLPAIPEFVPLAKPDPDSERKKLLSLVVSSQTELDLAVLSQPSDASSNGPTVATPSSVAANDSGASKAVKGQVKRKQAGQQKVYTLKDTKDNGGSFPIDSRIGEKTMNGQKEYKKFEFGGKIEHEDISEIDPQLAKFDQFKENRKRYNVGCEYEDTEYQPALNKEEFSESQKAHFDKLAKEIEDSKISSTLYSRHILEERNLIALADNENEEKLYSAVALNLPEKEEKVEKAEKIEKQEKVEKPPTPKVVSTKEVPNGDSTPEFFFNPNRAKTTSDDSSKHVHLRNYLAKNFQEKSNHSNSDLLEKLSLGDTKVRKSSALPSQNGQKSSNHVSPHNSNPSLFTHTVVQPEYYYSVPPTLPYFYGPITKYEPIDMTLK